MFFPYQAEKCHLYCIVSLSLRGAEPYIHYKWLGRTLTEELLQIYKTSFQVYRPTLVKHKTEALQLLEFLFFLNHQKVFLTL